MSISYTVSIFYMFLNNHDSNFSTGKWFLSDSSWRNDRNPVYTGMSKKDFEIRNIILYD